MEDYRVLPIGEHRIIDRREAGEIVIEARSKDALGKPKWDEVPSRIMNRPHVRAVPETLFFQMVRRLEASKEDQEFPETRPAAPAKQPSTQNGTVPAARLPRRIP